MTFQRHHYQPDSGFWAAFLSWVRLILIRINLTHDTEADFAASMAMGAMVDMM